ncbi:MAG: starch-binding protein [Clostridia bacterium]|nr:starch-binding protein [Clostridia bacterium]
MKKSNRFKALLSFVLIFTVLLSVSLMGLVGVSSASALTLDYAFLYNNPGYAEGRVSLSGNISDYGTYYLYWADDSKALEGYAEIGKIVLNKDTKYFVFDEFTAIPAGATKLIAVKSETEPSASSVTVADAAAVYTIPESKRFKYAETEKEYNFGAWSDVHVHKQDPPYYTYSELHFGQALEAATQRDADFVTICGDMINGYDNLYATEWAAYQKVIANSSYCNPIYETNGNHETKSDGDKAADTPYTYGIDTYKVATGLNVKTEKMQEESYYEVTAENGDHFIFMVLELDSSPNESSEFTKAQMAWLKGLLEKYSGDGHNIFINEHALIEGYGAGDHKELPLYAGGLQQSYQTVKDLMALLEKYPDVFFMSGHTHIDFKYGYNIDNRGGETCYTVHIPALTCTTQIVGGALDYTMYEDSSQGYFVDVYKDAVVYNGTDLVKNEILPAYTYFVDQSGEPLSKNDIGTIDDVTETVSVTVDVSNLAQNCEYVYLNAYNTVDGSATEYPGIPMTKNADGTYSCKVSKDYDKMYFIFNDSKLGRLGSDNYDVNNCKVVIGSDKITYKPAASWGSTIYAYVWSDTNTLFSWPGLLMTKDTATGEYYAYIPEDTFTMVVFNNGPSAYKTGDLDIAPYVSKGAEGSYTVIEPETQPATATEPETTVPVTSEATEPASTTKVTEPATSEVTEPSSTAPTEPAPETKYGDADCDDQINVKDATAVQKHAAMLTTLTEQGIVNGDVTGDGKVNVVDATTIQKFVAGLIVAFPVERGVDLAEVSATASQLTTLISTVKTTLADEYYYASYDAYMALKKAYYAYKDETVSALSATEITNAYNEITAKLNDYNTMKENNPVGGAAGGEITVYFTNNYSWSSVKAYAWGSGGTMKTWPGADMTYAKTNSQNQKIYSVTLDFGKYQNIIFTNGSSQTVDITLTGESGIGYYISGSSGGKYTCSTYTYM